MSEFGNKKSVRKVKFGKRFEIFVIKLRVRVNLKFLKNVKFEKDTLDIETLSELKEWSDEKGYTLKITEKEYPIYIYGHARYKMEGTRHRTILHFFR